MIELELAVQLKEAGLEWHPSKRDHFTLPSGELAHEVFTINDQTILVEMIKGQSTVTFHGTAEWALDDILLADVVWLPSESQLREAIQERLGGEEVAVALNWNRNGYHCTLVHHQQALDFEASTAEGAYGQALLFLLRREQQMRGRRWVNTA